MRPTDRPRTILLAALLGGFAPLAVAAQSTPGWSPRGGTLSADPQGWASAPTIAAAPDGSLYAAWAQHRNPSVWEKSAIDAAHWVDGAWQPLGGRIGDSAVGGFAPSIAMLGGTPYVAWYESDGGGVGVVGGQNLGACVFVAHWDGSQWVRDPDTSMPNGALNSAPLNPSGDPAHARAPSLAVVGGAVYAAWIEMRGILMYGPSDAVVVKHLVGGQWVRDGGDLTAFGGVGSKITDVAIAGVGGVAHVAWSECKRTYDATRFSNGPSSVQVSRWSGGAWVAVGGALNASPLGFTDHLALAALAGAPYVAWQERAAGAADLLRVKHWSGSDWVQDGGVLNVDPANGEAGRPALTSDGAALWLAWAEGAPGQPSQLYVRSLTGAGWSAAEGGLNRDPGASSADRPGLAVAGGIVHASWAERDFPSASKQVYVAGRDASGVAVAAALTRYGADGPAVAMVDNTWISLRPGGILDGAAGVGDESYDSFHYDPGTHRALVYGDYHGVAVSFGEDQNALMGYDFARNRWELIEAGESAWSEQLPGVGHDEGNSTVDTLHDLYITHGNLTLNSGVAYVTYVYDLRAGRGERMMPASEIVGSPRTDTMATAFDADHDLVLSVGPGGAWTYDHAGNAWTAVANSPSVASAALVYDTMHHVFVLFGAGAARTETWWFEPVAKSWTKRAPAANPPSAPYPTWPFMAYDSRHGICLLVGGGTPAVWSYDAGADAWTRLADAPAGVPTNQVDGLYLTYDSDDDVFLVRDGSDLGNLWAFRYAPGGATVDDTPPVLSSITASPVTDQGAIIGWTTDEPADGRVEYGTTAAYGSLSAIAASLTVTHASALTGLTAGTLYHYRVISADAAGNVATSADGTFTTAIVGTTTAGATTAGTTTGGTTTSGTTTGGTTTSGTTTGGTTTGGSGTTGGGAGTGSGASGGSHHGCGLGGGLAGAAVMVLALTRRRS